VPENSKSFLEVYRTKHQHPVNRVLHTVGIPLIVISLVIVFFNWRWGVGLFIVGWIFQFIGHVFEGNKPAFFKNPIYLIIGPLWWIKKLVTRDRSGTSGPSP